MPYMTISIPTFGVYILPTSHILNLI